MFVEVRYPNGDCVMHKTSPGLSPDEILKRFGLSKSRATVSVWPQGRPDLAEVIYRPLQEG